MHELDCAFFEFEISTINFFIGNVVSTRSYSDNNSNLHMFNLFNFFS